MTAVALEDPDPFSCPICLDPIEEPVTIPCGHNYCMACIEDYWNTHEHTETYSCPECREVFSPRPVLNKNAMFAEVVERFRKANLRDPSPDSHGPRKCSMCTGQRVQTVRYCPRCEGSTCQAHATRYKDASLREKHTVIVVGGEPPKNVCLHHNMPLEIYCRTDQQLICSLCFVEHHRGHDAVSVGPKLTERQVDMNSHENKRERRHRNRHRSHGHSRRRRKQSRHVGRGHGNGHRRSLHLKSGNEAGHHESRDHTLGRHGHAEEGGHTLGRNGNGRHGGRHRSSRHERSRH